MKRNQSYNSEKLFVRDTLQLTKLKHEFNDIRDLVKSKKIFISNAKYRTMLLIDSLEQFISDDTRDKICVMDATQLSHSVIEYYNSLCSLEFEERLL